MTELSIVIDPEEAMVLEHLEDEPSELVEVSIQHLEHLQQGGILRLWVNDEYLVYLKLKEENGVQQKAG